jgi:ubiquitin-conjugating enzyme E2 I
MHSMYMMGVVAGNVCLSILNEDKDWVPTISLKQILIGIQDLLDNPNLLDPAQRDAYALCKMDRKAYEDKVKKLAAAYASSE